MYLIRVFRGIAHVTQESDVPRTRAEQAALVAETANAVLLREQQRLQAVFDQSPEGIIFAEIPRVRYTGKSSRPNTPRRSAHAGTTAQRPLIARLFRANGVPLQTDDVPLHRALEGTSQIGVELTIEQQYGSDVFQCSSMPYHLHNAQGQMEGAVAVFQDLSRFREVERLKSDFVAMVSHELRTPLTAIQGCVQTLLQPQNAPDPEHMDEFLHIIATQSARLHDLIDNLLDMSQLEAGTFRLRVGSFQLGSMINQLVRQANEHFADVRVQSDIPQMLPTLHADQQRIEQVLLKPARQRI